jgi:hypothetical protein
MPYLKLIRHDNIIETSRLINVTLTKQAGRIGLSKNGCVEVACLVISTFSGILDAVVGLHN